MGCRESDSLIVPVKIGSGAEDYGAPLKAGNAAGGKKTTRGSAERGNTGRSQRRRTGGNETAPHSREGP